MVHIANLRMTTATSLFAERDARLARFRAKRAQDLGAVLKTPNVEESRSLKQGEKGVEEIVEGMKVAVEDHSLEEKTGEKAAVEQQPRGGFRSLRERVAEQKARELEEILVEARKEFPWPQVCDIPAELGPVRRLPYAQSCHTIEVLAVTYCGAAMRLANVSLREVLEGGMKGCRLGSHMYTPEGGKLSLEWAERREAYRKRRNSLVVEVGDTVVEREDPEFVDDRS